MRNIFLLMALVLFACAQPESAKAPSLNTSSAYDPDLERWSLASWSPFTVSDTIKGFAYGQVTSVTEIYIAVSATGKIIFSWDGDVWEPAALIMRNENGGWEPCTEDLSFNAIAFGNAEGKAFTPVFVAVSTSGKLVYSIDGELWRLDTEIEGFGTEDIRGVAFGKDRFVIVGGNGNIAYTTITYNDYFNFNGSWITWTPCKDAQNNFEGYINDVAYSETNETFYVVGEYGLTGYASYEELTKPEGFDWHYAFDESPAHANSINKLAIGTYNGEIGIGIVFDEWGGKRLALATLVDSFSGWDNDIDTSAFGGNTINGIAFGKGSGEDYFVAAGSSSMIGYLPTSTLGINWERYWRALPLLKFRYWEISAVAALNGRFFVGDVGGKIAYSK